MFYVRSLTGNEYAIPGETHGVPIDTILKIKQYLASNYQLPVNLQRLIFAGRELCNNETTSEAKLTASTSIHLVMLTTPNCEQEAIVVGYLAELSDWIQRRVSTAESCLPRPVSTPAPNEVSDPLLAVFKSMNRLADYVVEHY